MTLPDWEKEVKGAIPFELLETILYEPGEGLYLLPHHIDRLTASALFFGPTIFPLPDRHDIEARLLAATKDLQVAHRVRLLYNHTGEITIQTFPLIAPASNQEKRILVIAQQPIQSDNPFIHHKTTNRLVYSQMAQLADVGSNGIFDVVLYNEKENITETTIANIAVWKGTKDDGYWLTPPTSTGLLPGVMRGELMRKGELVEGNLTVDDLLLAEK
eukprot:Ihof_evm2s197 gene=Ihof_evmTU2s197